MLFIRLIRQQIAIFGEAQQNSVDVISDTPYTLHHPVYVLDGS
jgi:hypothetical protein